MPPKDELTQALEDARAKEEELRLIEARESFPAFCDYVMVDDAGKPWKFAAHQYEWSRLMDDPSIELLEMIGPRGSAKSTTVQARLLFELGRDPNMCIKYVCGNDAKAIDRLRFLRKNIVDNPRYRRVFPHIRPAEIEGEWTKHKAFIERPAATGLQDASIECASVTSGGTGGRAHRIIFDDIIDATDALARPGLLGQIKRFVEEDWMNLLYPEGRVWLIGTYWSFDPPDLYVEYKDNDEWHTWERPACQLDPAGEIIGPFLWPERWDGAALKSRRSKVGEESFMQQYLLQGAVQRADFFSPEHIAKCKDRTISLGEIPQDCQITRVGIGLDPATSLKVKTGSRACIYVAGLDVSGRKLPLAIIAHKADPEVITDTVLQQYVQWTTQLNVPTVILVENNATQLTFETLIRVIGERHGLTELPLKNQFTGSTKWSPQSGLPARNAELAQRKWIIPFSGDHTGPDHCPVCEWINEMTYWGKARDSRGRKPATDIIMAWWLASTAIDSSGAIGDFPLVAMREIKEVRYGPASRVALTY